MLSVYEVFYQLCNIGDTKEVKEYFYKHNINIINDKNLAIKIICDKNHIDLFEWVCSLNEWDASNQYDNDNDNDNEVLDINKLYSNKSIIHYCCKNNYIDLVKKSYHLFIKHFDDDDKVMLTALSYLNNNFKIFDWMINYRDRNYRIIEDIGLIVIKLCKYGTLNSIRHIYDNYSINIHTEEDYIFKYCCFNGHLDIAKWIYNLDNDIKIVDLRLNKFFTFEYVIIKGYLEIYKWLIDISDKVDINDIEYHFRLCCEKGHIDIAKWIFANYTFDIHNYDNDEFCFNIACEKGYVNMTKWLYEVNDTYPVDIHNENNYPFRISCENGHLELVKWLYTLGNVNVNGMYCFKYACRNGHLDIVKWLYSLPNTNIPIPYENHYCFKYACVNGHYNVVLWLFDLYYAREENKSKINSIKINNIFNQTLENGNFLVVKWIHATYKIDVLDTSFKITCTTGFLTLCKWIKELYDRDGRCLENDTVVQSFINACINNHLYVSKWLYLNFSEIISNIDTVNIIKLFNNSCRHGSKEVVIWLYSVYKDKFPKDTTFNYAFRHSCRCNHYDIANWIYNLNVPLDISNYNNYAFRRSCRCGNLKIIKWLYELESDKGVYDSILKENFILFCSRGYLSLVKWVYYNTNIKIDYVNGFIESCKVGRKYLCKWIYSQNLFDISDNNHLALITACKYRNLYIVKWICKLSEYYEYSVSDYIITPIILNKIEYYTKCEMWDEIVKFYNWENTKNNLEICVICYEPANLITDCGHSYCVECLFKWNKINKLCSYCKTKIELNKCKYKSIH